MPDKRLTEVLVSYWQHDALLQLLLHAVLLQHGALLQQGSHQQQGPQPEAQQPEAGDSAVVQAAAEVTPARSVGLPELLSAVQELSKVCGNVCGMWEDWVYRQREHMRTHACCEALLLSKIPQGSCGARVAGLR